MQLRIRTRKNTFYFGKFKKGGRGMRRRRGRRIRSYRRSRGGIRL